MGKLVLIATPIGNMEDLSYRAARMLGELDALACEDTRVTRRIFERYSIASPRTVFAYHEHNEETSGRRILGLLEEGLSVGICSDGGCPGICDPGYRAIRAALAAGHTLEVLPGPSAVHTALLLSGLPSSSYTFKGFPPRKTGARKRFLELDRSMPHTLVFFESPFRIGAFLADALDVLGDREAAVCLELTKHFERVHRGRLSVLVPQFATQPKGEATIVIAGLQRADAVAEEDDDGPDESSPPADDDANYFG